MRRDMLLAALLAGLPGAALGETLPIDFLPGSAEVPRAAMRAIPSVVATATAPPVLIVPSAAPDSLDASRTLALRSTLAQLGLRLAERRGTGFALEYRLPTPPEPPPEPAPAPKLDPVRDAMSASLETMDDIERALGHPVGAPVPLVPSSEPPAAPLSVPSPPGQLTEPAGSGDPAKAEPAQPEPVPEPDPQWHALAGGTLRETLEAWASEVGWRVDWQPGVDYPLEYSAHLSGSFEEAARRLVEGFAAAKPRPRLSAFANQVVVVHTGVLP